MAAYRPDDFDRHGGITLPPSSSGRSEFARDRDRITYTSAFRALSGKTQVVAAGELGNFHTRLTHTLKVAQLGRVIAKRLSAGQSGPDPDLVEAACLAHDIGHPPFGHAGETALSDTIDILSTKHKNQAPDGFEGNAQNFRILAFLSVDRPWNVAGLHLTRATMRAVTKYPWPRYSFPEPKFEGKWGIYDDHRSDLKWMLENTGNDGAIFPIEEQIMDWCDDVTYACHDMEDFYKHGMIPLDRLIEFRFQDSNVEESAELSRFLDFLEIDWKPAKDGGAFDRGRAVATFRDLKNLIRVRDVYRQSREMDLQLRESITNLISYFADDVRVIGSPPCGYAAQLEVDEDKRFACTLLKKLIWFYVIRRPQLAGQQFGQRKIVQDLLTWHFENPDLLPGEPSGSFTAKTSRLRAACDYVAGLPEAHAYVLHRRLSGADPGLITDLV